MGGNRPEKVHHLAKRRAKPQKQGLGLKVGQARDTFPQGAVLLQPLCEEGLAETGRPNGGTEQLETLGSEGLEVAETRRDQTNGRPDLGLRGVEVHATGGTLFLDDGEGADNVLLRTGNDTIVQVPTVGQQTWTLLPDVL
jgi:hypothetical protein